MKKVLLAISAILFIAAPAFAVPAIQLYIPGATYDSQSDTWVTPATDFELWVIVANLDKQTIFDLTLVASLKGGEAPKDGGLTITPEGGSAITYNAGDFTYGTPPISDPIPSHGIYPTDYTTLLVASTTTSGPFETVQDYTQFGGGSSAYGQIFKFNVSSKYNQVHFDAYGFHEDIDGRRMFAPFSHDAEAVPEPTSLVLFGLGMGVAGVIRRRKKMLSL